MTAVIYRGDRSGTGFFHRTVQYWLDRTEVTQGDYDQFLKVAPGRKP